MKRNVSQNLNLRLRLLYHFALDNEQATKDTLQAICRKHGRHKVKIELQSVIRVLNGYYSLYSYVVVCLRANVKRCLASIFCI